MKKTVRLHSFVLKACSPSVVLRILTGFIKGNYLEYQMLTLKYTMGVKDMALDPL